MDWYVIDAPNNVLFDLTVPDGTRLMGIAGAPYLLMLGMNSHGIGNVSNSVHCNDNRVGVPNAFVRRASLEARVARGGPRARPARGARARHQPLPRRHARPPLGRRDLGHGERLHGPLVRRLHGAHQPLRRRRDGAVRGGGLRGIAVRLATAERILAEGLARGDDPVELVARALRCHDPAPEQAICGHPDESEPLPSRA